jgi:hypothetical protein
MKKLILSIPFFIIASITMAQTPPCEAPEIDEVTGGGTYCFNQEVTLEIKGDLNNATTWTWYTGSCGGTVVGTGTTLKVKVEKTTTYYVRGTGGCVANTAECEEVEVKLDDIGPEILTCQENIVVPNEPGLCSAVVTFNHPTAKDNCSAQVTIKQMEGPVSGSAFPVGVTNIKFELADDRNNISVCSFTITVEDKEAPVITCIENIEVDNEPGKCGAVVTYIAPVGTDNCPDAVTELTEGLGSGAFFPVGTTTETYTVTDASGNTTSCSFTVTVKDVEPPVITINDKKLTFWPPNHKHQPVDIDDFIESVSDNCGGITIDDVIIDEIGSDEPNNGQGDGNTSDDILIDEDCREAKLRAERSGNGNGRVYVVTVAVMDLHGNIGTAEFTVSVPHDMGKKNEVVRDEIVYRVNGCDLIAPEPVPAEETEPTSRNTNEAGREVTETVVYPNPYSRNITLLFTPITNDFVTVEIYNLMGVQVGVLHQQNVEANTTYQWNLETPEIANGTGVLLIRGERTYKTIRLLQSR